MGPRSYAALYLKLPSALAVVTVPRGETEASPVDVGDEPPAEVAVVDVGVEVTAD
jgi:hypothetical protein